MKNFFYIIFLLGMVTPAWATTFTVSNLNDAGASSFRQALLDANADGSATAGSPHIINFTLTGQINLNTALPVITNHMTINGHSSGNTVFRGTAAFYRILEVNAPVTVEINRLNMQNGDPGAAGVTGAGFQNALGTTTLNNCVLDGNFTSAGTGGHGGGAANISGTLNINNSTIKNNTANNGNGGGVYANGGTLSLTNCTVQNNNCTVGGNGGGLGANTGATLNLINCTVIGNFVAGSTGFSSGGLILLNTSFLNMTNTILANNNNFLVPADYSVLGVPIIGTNNNNIVEVCLSTSCAIFASNADPLLSGLVQCGLQDIYRPTTGSFAIDGGTPVGAPTADICGSTWVNLPDIGSVESTILGTTLDFDGTNDYVTMGNVAALKPTTEFSLEAWIKADNVTGQFEIISSGSDGPGLNGYHLNVLNGQVFFVMDGSNISITAGTINTGVWYHIAATYSVTNGARLYLDGTFIGADNTPLNPVAYGAEPVVIGTLAGSLGTNNFDGEIDEVRIWNRELCTAEIAAQRNCELVGTETGLAAYYQFNQGISDGSNPAETTLLDATAGANNGTLTNFALTGSSSNWSDGTMNGVSGTCSATFPEIDILGNAVSIANGDITPSVTDDTEFGSVDIASGFVDRTYTVDNSAGTSNLTIAFIGIAGPNAADFSISSPLSPASPIPAGGSATFTIRFDPTTVGSKTANINIFNNDCNESPYVYDIHGTGVQIETIAITEWISDPSGTDAQEEWVELYNYGVSPVDIQNWVIRDEDTDNDIIIASSYIIPPGGYVIITNSKATFESNWFNGCVKTEVLEVSGLTLTNTTDEIEIVDDLGTVTWSVAYADDETVGRATHYTESPTFTNRIWGSQATPGVVRNGNDITFTLGYEKNNVTADPNAVTAANGDIGSPLNGTAGPPERVRGDVLTFDGTDDYVDVGNVPAFDFDKNNTFSVETWAKISSGSGGSGQIITKYTDGGGFAPVGWQLGHLNGIPTFTMGGGSIVDFAVIQGGASDLRDDTWHHIAVTYDGSNDFLNGTAIYIDGVLQSNVSAGFATTLTGSAITTANVTIGAFSNPADYFFGDLDEVRVWNTTRTANEIRENMHLTLKGCETGGVAYFQLNDGTGSSTVTDATNGNNGTLMNMVPAAAWVTSGVNVGNDVGNTSISQTVSAIPAGASTQNFATTNVQMQFTAHSGVEDITVTYQAFTPNATAPIATGTIHQNPMWTVNKSDAAATFTANMRFTYPAATITTTNACNLKLYNRPMGSDGNWTEVASTASAFSTTFATFDNISVAGQFMVVEASSPDLIRDRGLTFDGNNDFVDIPNPSTLDTDPHTIEAWVKIPALPADVDRIIQRGLDGFGAGWSLALDVTPTGQVSFATCCVNQGSVLSTTALMPNQWYHLAAVYVPGATGSVTLYINGINEGTTALTNPLLRSSTQGWILGKGNLANEFFNGSMDEVRIWNIARTESDIRENMHLTLTGCETGIVSYYQMNETVISTVLPDKIGGNDGLLTAMTPAIAWTVSDVNVGNDAANNSNSVSIAAVPAGTSSQNFAAANLMAEFTAHSGVEDFCVTYENFTPNATTGAAGATIVDNPVWTVNKSTLVETQTMNLTFTFPAATLTSNNVCDFKLYNRTMNADGNWTLLSSAAAARAGNTVTFNDLTTTGQFMVVEDPVVGADIVRGDALDFDGIDDYVSIPHTPTRDFGTGDFTTECWFKYGTTQPMTFPALLGWRTGGDFAYLLYTTNASHQLIFQMTGTNYGPIGPALNDNQWHHVALSRNAGNVTVYLDGISIYTNTILTEVTSNGPMNIGWDAANPGATYFDGPIEETRIWSVARTENEIRENMHLTLKGCEQGLIAYYQMNDGAGLTLTDKSGNGNDGTLNGGTAWTPSGVNVGNDAIGNSRSETIAAVPVGASTQTFAAANLEINFLAHTGVEDFTVTYQEFTPNAVGGIDAVTLYQNPMWTINKSTTTETFQADLTFTYPASPFTVLDPTKYALYWRPMYSDGNWTKVCAARDVYAGLIKFGNISLTGQFMVAMESDPLVSDVRGGMYTISENSERIFVPGIDLSNSSFTIELWAKRNSSTTEDHFFGQGTAGVRAGLHARYHTNGSISFAFFSDDFITAPGQPAATDGAWHHLAFVYNSVSRQREIFVDGVSLGTNIAGGNFNGAAGMNIGAHIPPAVGINNSFDGPIDEFRVWTSVRTQAEIRENMHLTLKGNETGLLSYYQFNNDAPVGTAGGVKDAMGNNDGTTVNMVASDYLASEVAVAGGVSDRITIGASGVTTFPNTGVSIEFGGTHPNGEIVISRLETEKPHGWNTLTGDVDNEYFVINNYGTNQTFSDLIDVTFNRLNYISPADVPVAQPTNPIQIFKRKSNDFGATWGGALGGVGADALTAGSVGMASFNINNPITSFSQIVLVNSGPNSDLPVEFLSFEAERIDKEQVQLNWTTATETNNQGFDIERMLEHETAFTKVGYALGQGTTVTTTYYQKEDANDYQGVSYYRLKQIDFDGSVEYSEIRAVNGGGDNGGAINVDVFPNPVKDNVTVRFGLLPKGVTSSKIQVLDLLGKVLHVVNVDVKSYNQLTIDFVKELPSAVYMLSIELDNGENMTQKFIKE